MKCEVTIGQPYEAAGDAIQRQHWVSSSAVYIRGTGSPVIVELLFHKSAESAGAALEMAREAGRKTLSELRSAVEAAVEVVL